MPAQASIPEVVDIYFRSVNGRDWATLESVLSPDVRFEQVGRAALEGRDSVLSSYPPLLEQFRSHRDVPRRAYVAGHVVTVELTFDGLTRAGTPVSFDAIELFELDGDGRIARLSLWYDTREVARHVRSASGAATTSEAANRAPDER